MRKAAKEAAQAHSDLNIFSAIIAILEGGMVYTTSGNYAAGRIIEICKEEAARQLRRYDAKLNQIEVEGPDA